MLFSSLTFKMPAKNYFFNTIFSGFYFLKLHLHHFSKIKSQKESKNSRNQGFSYYFYMVIEGSGSESGRPKNMWIRIWIRIRIRNTGCNHSQLWAGRTRIRNNLVNPIKSRVLNFKLIPAKIVRKTFDSYCFVTSF